MTKQTWPIGPARCVDTAYSAEIIGLHDGYYVGVASCETSEYRSPAFPAMWRVDGKNANGHRSLDLLPPKLTRDEAINECISAYIKGWNDGGNNGSAVRECLEHWDKLKAEGRIDE